MSNISVADDAMAGVKKELRKHISTALKAIENAEIERQSQRLAESICALPEFRDAKALSVYLEMPKEAATRALLEAAFAANKRVYVPKITGRGAEDLKMVHALSLEDIDGFPKDKWRIPDPPLLGGDGTERDDPIKALDLELVLLPGVAFDRSGGRLGHGKGYYDSFLRRLSEEYAAKGKPLPTTIGLCLSAQLVDQVPLSPHDRMLDVVVTPEQVLRVIK
ncbi:5-formyltetrahydrofolate cyclo-ligase [Globisporangium polare]